jgi:hypothetical protein
MLPRLLLGNSNKLLCGKKRGMLIKEVEVKTIPPVPPEKAKIDALKRQKSNLSKTIKAEKARATINKGQQQLSRPCKYFCVSSPRGYW